MPIGRIGQDFIVDTTVASNQISPSVTALADGRFVVTWQSQEATDGSLTCIRGRLYNADGSAAGNDFIVDTTATGDQQNPSVTGLADGRFVVTWGSDDPGDGSGACIRGRLYNSDGSTVGNDFIVDTTATGDQQNPSVTALADGRVVVTWQSQDTGDGSGTCIRGRLYNPADSTIGTGDDFIVDTTATSNQSAPSVMTLADGSFVVAWQSDDTGDGSGTCIRGRLYNAGGSAVGNDFIVNTTATFDQRAPSVTALADGRFVVTWQSQDTGDGSLGCIRGRLYNAGGSAVGNDFIIDTTATNDQFMASVTALADGRFVVTWYSQDTGDGSLGCVRGRLYNADGSADGNDFIVDTTATGEQFSPSVTALADGRFVVTWESDDTGDGSQECIRGQIFDPTIFVGTVGEDVWTGGNFADRIHGYGSNDTFSGLGGGDIINGDAGNDTLDGGADNDRLFGGLDGDTLTGGLGRDILFGGAGLDHFVFQTPKDSRKGANADIIRDFSHAEGDLIDLSLINSKKGAGNQAFKFISAQQFHHKAGELHYANHILSADVNGDGKADFEIHINANSLIAADFIL